ncbi:CHAT domain-containing protein [Mycena sp. CBHHK59/15]|nr:CHAT domain-containing protein [Mycena sp. CBHHK59/15]
MSHETDHLNQAICAYQDAERDCPENPTYLEDVAIGLANRWDVLGNRGDMKRAISAYERAVKVTPRGLIKALRLGGLGIFLRGRFTRLGDNDDINRAVSTCEAALQLIPEGHPLRLKLLQDFGDVLSLRFRSLRDLGDLNKSISVLSEVVRLTFDDRREKPTRLNSLGISLYLRFRQLGDVGDLDEAILALTTATRLLPDDNVEKPYILTNIGISMLCRFHRLGSVDDITEAVRVLEDALQRTPAGDLYRMSRVINLAASLCSRYQRLGELHDINKSISVLEGAARMTPATHNDRPAMLQNLGVSLQDRFNSRGDARDIDASILMLRESAQLTPDGDPNKPSILLSLGDALYHRHEKFGCPLDYIEMMANFVSAAAATTGSPRDKFNACMRWALEIHCDPSPTILPQRSLFAAYTTALDLLPEVAWLGLSIGDRHKEIMEAGRMVRDAAGHAVSLGQHETAVEWLEQGRFVIWGQLSDLRSPVDALKEHHPDLAERFIFLSTQLENAGTRDACIQMMNDGNERSPNTFAQEHHEYAREREQLLKKIRGLEGFGSFLRRKRISELFAAAKLGPVIMLNISLFQEGCDALILVPGQKSVMHVPLPAFSLQDAEILSDSLATLLGHGHRSGRLNGKREGELTPDDQFAHILSEIWLKISKPILNALGITRPSRNNLQRVWWCPTGVLASLPLHAAGLHDENGGFGSHLSDFVISSYTPSLAALIKSLRPIRTSGGALKILAVAQPCAFGQSYLPGTREEIDRIELHARGMIPILRLEEDMATVASVQQAMQESGWVHFACHGVQDVRHPTESALFLAGKSRLTLLDIMKQSLPHTDFAFLSACQTATGTKELQDESVHLAAGMLLAGYRGVVATMWSIRDEVAPQVADDVYQNLFKTSPPDATQAAEALHLAVQRLREGSEKTKSFFHWVPFIHIGV